MTSFDQVIKLRLLILNFDLPYSWKIWQFGSLACDCQIKICQYFTLAYICMAIPY